MLIVGIVRALRALTMLIIKRDVRAYGPNIPVNRRDSKAPKGPNISANNSDNKGPKGPIIAVDRRDVRAL